MPPIIIEMKLIGGHLEVIEEKICRDIQANWSESGWEMR